MSKYCVKWTEDGPDFAVWDPDNANPANDIPFSAEQAEPMDFQDVQYEIIRYWRDRMDEAAGQLNRARAMTAQEVDEDD